MSRAITKNSAEITTTLYKVKRDIAAWEAIRGIWKGKAAVDPVKWQRQLRKEWERRLS